MELSALVAFVGVAVALILVPGPDWALVLGAGLRTGVVVPAVSGLALGYVLITTVVVVGVAPVVAAAPAALVALTVVGAGYLVWVGTGILRSAPTPAAAPDAAPVAVRVRGAGTARTVRQGVGVSALNPKSLLFFLAFLPQFARPAAPWPFAVQLAVLGLVWVALAAGFYTLLGFTLRRGLAERPWLAAVVTRVAGGAMLAVGLGLAVEQAVRLVW